MHLQSEEVAQSPTVLFRGGVKMLRSGNSVSCAASDVHVAGDLQPYRTVAQQPLDDRDIPCYLGLVYRRYDGEQS